MQRLTKRDRGGNAVMDCDNCEIKYRESCCSLYHCRNALIAKLAAYEDTELTPEEFHESVNFVLELNKKLKPYMDAEEQGRLVILPCKVGDTVFYTTGSAFYKAKAIALRINDSGIRVYCERKFMGVIGFEGIFGKTVFLTREEAEDALKGEGKDV